MKELWANISKRERIFLLVGALALLLLASHLLVVEPVASSMERYRREVPQKRETLLWMQSARDRVLQERKNSSRRKPGQSFSSPLVAIEKTARQWSLDQKLKRLEPEGETEVKVWLDEVIFDDLILWLELLESDHAIRVGSLTVEQRDAPGIVDARIVFAGGGK